MSLPQVAFHQPPEGSSSHSKPTPEECVPTATDEKQQDELHPIASLMPPTTEGNALHDLMSARAWGNHIIWRAGIIEGVASGSLNVITGLMAATLSTWPRAAIPAGILIGNTIVIACLISATATVTGAHINPMVTMAIAFSGLCHPVRAAIYVFCQLVGGSIGGSLLRVALGTKLAYKIHNAGCWIDPDGEVTVWQAASTEFTCTFVLLFLAYGVGIDPRQAKLFGARYGPVLVGFAAGVMTSITATIHPGYTGAAMFPGRCFGLAVGIGEFQTSHWVWWIPAILAAAVHAVLYRAIPPYMRQYTSHKAAV